MESLAERFNRSESAVIAVHPEHGLRCNNSLAKRAFDVTFALAALACSAPILILCFIAISVQSRGWPIFVQRRVGRSGKVFNIYKLRTMYSGSDSHAFKTAREDHRLTPVGRLLRNANIDELPQLINIIVGDMSVIGPRPLSVDETDYIQRNLKLDPDHPGLIPSVRPGLVGLEQINRDKELTYLDRFAFNHDYETAWTLSMDWYIFLRALSVCRDVCIAACSGALVLVLSYALYVGLS